MGIESLVLLGTGSFVGCLVGFILGTRYAAREWRFNLDELCRLSEERDRMVLAWAMQLTAQRDGLRSGPMS